ncbi:MAG TPA: VWA domain-containing protein [Phycisphaerales bacterium]|nr:VWA domain-containing protein [Phycisphaerales bacterium]
MERNVKVPWRSSSAGAEAALGGRGAMPPQPANDRDDVLPPSLWQLVVKWGTSLTVLALVVSLVVHISGGVLASFIRMHGDMGGRGAGGGQPVEMAIGAAGPLSDVPDAAAGPSLPAVPEDVGGGSVELSMASAGGLTPGVSDGGGEAGGTELGGLGGSLSGGGDISIGSGLGGGGGGGGGASFFGVEASGNRFAFVVDVSSSMEADNRIARLKQEIRATVDNLAETAEFVIYTFSDESRVLGGKAEWRQASAATRRRVLAEVDSIVLGPSTQPLPAFEGVFAIRPRPDAVYFMTDGQFEETVVERVAIMSRSAGGVPVHCICFGDDAGGQLLQRIASITKGTYTFIPSK